MENDAINSNYLIIQCYCGKKYKIPKRIIDENEIDFKCKECGEKLLNKSDNIININSKYDKIHCGILLLNSILLSAIIALLIVYSNKPIKIEEPISIEGVDVSSRYQAKLKPIFIQGTVDVNKIKHDVTIRRSYFDLP